EVFQDRERLGERLARAVDQGRHDALGVQGLVGRRELVALEQVERNLLDRDALQGQRDANTERRLRAPVGVERDGPGHATALTLTELPALTLASAPAS